MLGRTNTGGGGGGVNYQVVGNPQPSNPKGNIIWINTNVKITGHYLQPTQPDNMQPGEVWISTGTTSLVTFNALKKNTVMVCPISAKQMQSGKLVDVTAKSWLNGKWVDWITYLFKNGKEYTELTGGWTTSGYSFGGTAFGSVINDGNELVVSYVSGSTWGGVGTNNKVHLRTGTLFAAGVADAAVGEKYSSVRITATKETTTENLIAYVALSPGTFAVSLPIDEEGDYYISFLGVTKVSEVRHE